MRNLLASFLIMVFLFAGCSGATRPIDTEVTLDPDWNDLKVGLLLASYGGWDTGRLESFEYYVRNLGVITNQVLYSTDRSDLTNSIDIVGNPVPDSRFESLLNLTDETLDMFRDKAIATSQHSLELLDADNIKTRITKLNDKLRVKNNFERINIQIDPSLAPGLTRVSVDGNSAEIFIHTEVTYEYVEQGYIAALLMRESKKEDFDLTQIEKLTKQYGTALSGWEQFLSDFAYALQLWCGAELDPDMMTYLVYSSVKFNHIFSAQLSHWAGNFMQFKDMSLKELVPYGIEDASNPIYERLLVRLVDPARIGIVIDDESENLIISGFVKETPAEISGLMVGDQIVRLDTEDINQRWMLERKLYDKDPNSYVILKVRRDVNLPTDGAVSILVDERDPDFNLLSFQFLLSRAENLPEGVY